MKTKAFIITFVSVFILLSLPAIFGVGYVIDWVPGATVVQKLRGYVVDGLLSHFYLKAGISIVISIVLSMLLYRRQLKAE
ncbi:hypothetical protein [Jeotgalibacillus haloalkalitolerans]|uniref:DUF4321 domain-containing protein n=1 Tax=Jeotgalibacillus haloalkalitolerans TaxID=3104292 RepID=A0ABU5KNI5_9BACL|nr:hypothetical protein [Jeotgalibacillus sp. HH7-29]MDZ5712709.1 hypothetical protein [Jeotgalibacillus sp. HH7-29]